MAQASCLMLSRFTRLPRRSGDTWQGGVVRMPMWVDGPDGTPYRPWGGAWVSLETGVVNVKIAEAEDGHASLALDALLELGFKFARTRPAAIQVAEPAPARLSHGRQRVDGRRTSVVCHGQQGGGGDLRRRAGGRLERDARCARVARGPRARRKEPEASPALIQLRGDLSERPDRGQEGNVAR